MLLEQVQLTDIYSTEVKDQQQKHLFFLLKRQFAVTDVKAAPSFLFCLLWCSYICVMLVETEPAAVSFPG